MTVAVSISSFRAAFPEFGKLQDYADGQITFWLTLSTKMFDAGRWGELLDHGTMLFVAHNLALQKRAEKDAQFGKIPGQATGPVTSKSVDKVSVSHDTASIAEEGAGAFNLTTYGQQYIRLARLIGAGPVHFGHEPPGAAQWSPAAYAGPYLG